MNDAPPRVRRVSAGRWQARVWIGEPINRHLNLGCYPSEWEASRASRDFLRGDALTRYLADGTLPAGCLPRFVHAIRDGFTAWAKVGPDVYRVGVYATADEAHQAIVAIMPPMPEHVFPVRDGYVGEVQQYGYRLRVGPFLSPERAAYELQQAMIRVERSDAVWQAIAGDQKATHLWDPEAAATELARRLRKQKRRPDVYVPWPVNPPENFVSCGVLIG